MTVTVFDCDHQPHGSQPEHKKPTFTEVARKLRVIRVRIIGVRQNLCDIDRMLNDLHEAIRDLEEIDNGLRRR